VAKADKTADFSQVLTEQVAEAGVRIWIQHQEAAMAAAV
jgi:hypothetical protein